MKKFTLALSVFFILFFSINNKIALAQPKKFPQGIYFVKDSGIVPGTPYNVQNTSSTDKAILIIIDSDHVMQELIKFEPSSPKYSIKPLPYGSIFIVIGSSGLTFY